MIRENDNFNQNNNQYYRQNNNQQNINNNDYHSKIQQEIESIRNEMLNNRMNMQNQLNEIKVLIFYFFYLIVLFYSN